ncbi:MAG: RNA 2',3'-cyclic phosphodiesterase [Bdellovibrionaceae bacterium]|nr:RNA 2',3'-cyclic phosphodiesterase [Pseudobdellovibrionaceae bacterium]
MATKRLFLALAIDSERFPELIVAGRKLRIHADRHEMNVKWSPPSNWHITLMFLGDVEEDRLPKLGERLFAAAARASAFEIRISGMGAFPDERHARVIWAGTSRSQPILDVQTALETEFGEEGFAPEQREFHPHLTLGRLRSAGSVREMISPFVRRHFGEERIEQIVLFESIQQGHFPVYIPLLRASLTAPKI